MYNNLKFLKLDFDTSSFNQATYKQMVMASFSWLTIRLCNFFCQLSKNISKRRRVTCDIRWIKRFVFVWEAENMFNCFITQVWMRECFIPPRRNLLKGAHMVICLRRPKMGEIWQNGVKPHRQVTISRVAHRCPALTAGSCPPLGICSLTAQVKKDVD